MLNLKGREEEGKREGEKDKEVQEGSRGDLHDATTTNDSVYDKQTIHTNEVTLNFVPKYAQTHTHAHTHIHMHARMHTHACMLTYTSTHTRW